MWMVKISEESYPRLLKDISGPPPVLYVRGTLLPEDAAAVAIVGTRAATPYGLKVARELAQGLARAGITVVSGLAQGIDGAAHEGALEAGGRTLAVLGHGLDHLFPPIHKELSQRILDSGALVTEFPLGMPPLKNNFPQRNRIISGLSLGVVVVEAPVASGALITAHCALEQGREVFAVPGPISSKASAGTHRLLKDGAKLVEEVSDVLEELTPHLKEQVRGWKKERLPLDAENGKRMSLSREEALLYEAVPVGSGVVADTLAAQVTLAPSQLLSLLTSLELKGLVRQIPGQGYSRT